MNNISVDRLPINDLQFYASSLRCIIPANELIQKKIVRDFPDLYISPFSPIKEHIKQLESFSREDLTVTKEISEIAVRMFSALKSSDANLANRSYDEFTEAVLELHDELSPELEEFEGTDLVIVSPERAGIVKNGITRREFAKIDRIYKMIQGGKTSFIIRDSIIDPDFRGEVLRNIRILLSRDSGRQILVCFAKPKIQKLTIEHSSFSFFNGEQKVIGFDIDDRQLEVFNENGSCLSLFPFNSVTIFHELVHAKHYFDGVDINGPSSDPAFPDQEEEITVTGQTFGREEYLSENRFLAEFDFPTRSSYVSIDSKEDINEVFKIAARKNIDGEVDRILETNLVSQNSIVLGLEHASKNKNLKIHTSIRNYCTKRGVKFYKEPLLSPLKMLSILASPADRSSPSSVGVASQRGKRNIANFKNTRKKIVSQFSKIALTSSEVDMLMNRPSGSALN